MLTFNEILAAAALLSPSELGRLCSALERRNRLANAIELKTRRQITFRLNRLTDSEHSDALRHSLAIADDYGCYLDLRHGAVFGETLNFAQVYLTLKHLVGESSRFLDKYKTAFSFPFALDVIKPDQTFAYMLEVHNRRDSLYFSLRKIVDARDQRLKDGRILPPFADEFGKEEIRCFINCFYGYLLGRWETLGPEELQPFVHCVPAALLLFGFGDGKAFEEQFESCAEYEAAWQRFQTQIEQERQSSRPDACILRDEHSPDRRD